MGLGPYNTRTGDVVVILFGGDVCFMLHLEWELFHLVGDCYVQNAMRGR
jgi:hypothetical protein